MELINKMLSQWKSYLFFSILFVFISSLSLVGSFNLAHISLLILPILYWFVFLLYKRNLFIKDKVFVYKIFFISLIVRVLGVFVFADILLNLNGYPFLSMKDDYNYQQASIEIVNRWRVSGIGFYSDIWFSTGFYSGFPNFSAFLMYVFGDSIYVPRLGNAFFSSLTSVLAYQIVSSFTTQKRARLVAVIFVFSPLLFSFSSLQLKDTVLLYLTFAVVKRLIFIIENKSNITNLILLGIYLLIIVFFRAATIIPLLVSFLIILFIKSKKQRKISLYNIISLSVIIFTLIYGWKFLTELNGVDSLELYVTSRYDKMQNQSFENSEIGGGKNIIKFLGTPVYFLFSFFLPPALLVNLPNMETINYTLFGLVFHYSLIPFLIVAVVNTFKERKKNIIPFFLLLLFFMFKLGQANSLQSVFNTRQSLGGIYLMYLMLPMFFIDNKYYYLKNKTFIISLIVMLAFTYVRLNSRGII